MMGQMPPQIPQQAQEQPEVKGINPEEINLAEKLKKRDPDLLNKIGMECKRGFDLDDASRSDWLKDVKIWTDIAKQLKETKTWPWKNASNVKYPLISTAAMQFAARAYPTLVPSDGQIVKSQVVGQDPDGKKTDQGTRIEKYMSWQLMYQMENWEEDMDKMLVMLPVMGMMYKKTYYDKFKDNFCSDLVYPENFVIDYYAKSIEDAERFSEVFCVSQRVLKERQAANIYLDIDLGTPPTPEPSRVKDNKNVPSTVDEITPYTLVNQACWLDLDDDDIKEPYYVVFHKESGKVLRIYARFDVEGVKVNEKGKIIGFEPICQYTKFGFIPNPDGSFYDLGFGHLLGPLNESVNTLINQLVDAGTINNLQAGFIGKGLRVKMGDTPLGPGEWRVVNSVGDDLRKQMIPIPSKEPSNVLYELLGMLITSGKELASVAEIFVGKMPGQNTPATTTMASIEQGMKVFTAIYKRIYRALDKEFKKLFDLNSKYLDRKTYAAVLDSPIDPTDFNKDTYNVCPAADPQAASQTEKLNKAQMLLQLVQLGTLDPMEVTARILQAQDQPDWQKLLLQQQRPDPKAQELQLKMQAEQQKAQIQGQVAQQKMAMEQQSHQAKLAQQAQEHQMEMQQKQQELALDAQVAQHKAQAQIVQSQVQAHTTMQQAQTQVQANKLTAQQKLQHGEDAHKQKMNHAKEQQKLTKTQQKPHGSSGKTTKSQK